MLTIFSNILINIKPARDNINHIQKGGINVRTKICIGTGF